MEHWNGEGSGYPVVCKCLRNLELVNLGKGQIKGVRGCKNRAFSSTFEALLHGKAFRYT